MLRVSPREYATMAAFLSYPPAWIEDHWTQIEAGIASTPDTPEAKQIVEERIAALTAFDRSAEIGRIALPSLVIGAEDDHVVPGFMQRDLATRLTNAELRMLSSGGHFFPVTRTQDFLHVVGSWLDHGRR